MQHLHSHQIIFGIYALCQLVFVFGKWKWISQALCENNYPSSMRLSGFMLIQVVCLCEVWNTLKTQKFDTTHLLYLLVAVGALYGIIKAAQVLAFKNGTKEPASTDTK